MTYIEFLEGVGRAADKLSPKSIHVSVLVLLFLEYYFWWK